MKKILLLLILVAGNLKASFKITEQKGNSLTLKFTLNDSIGYIGKFVYISGGNRRWMNKTGYPDIPVYRTFISTSQSAGNCDYTVKQQTVYSSAPLPVPTFGKDEMVKSYAENKKLYKKDFPLQNLRCTDIVIRGYHFIEVEFIPLRFNSATKRTTVFKNAVIHIALKNAGKNITGHVNIDSPFIESFVLNKKDGLYLYKQPKQIQENTFDSALVWYKIPIVQSGLYSINYADIEKASSPGNTFSSNMISIWTVGPDTLPSHLNEYTMKKIPVDVHDNNNNGIFDSGDYFTFYASAPDFWTYKNGDFSHFQNPYTDTTYYWVGMGGITKKMQERNYSHTDFTVDRSTYYFHHEQDMTNIAWKGILWEGEAIVRYSGDTQGQSIFSFSAEDAVNDSGTLRIRLIGGESDISRNISINCGYDTFNYSLAGLGILNTTVYPLRLKDNAFTVTINRGSGSDTYGDQVYLDYYDLIYTRSTSFKGADRLLFLNDTGVTKVRLGGQSPAYVINITDPENPYTLNIYNEGNNYYFNDSTSGPSVYMLVKDLKTPLSIRFMPYAGMLYRDNSLSGTNMLIITSQSLLPSLFEYKAYRENHFPVFDSSSGNWIQGKGNVRIVSTKGIYDNFGFGMPDPVAIRNFVYYVYNKGSTGASHNLKYLLLMGDGTYDYRDITHSGGNVVPPFEPFETTDINSPGYGENENFWGDMNNNGYPDIFIGRVPVRTAEDIVNFTSKLESYEQANGAVFYKKRIMYVADDEYGPNRTSDSEYAMHVPYANALYTTYTPADAEKVTVYEMDYGSPTDLDQRGRDARKAFIETFNIGSLISVFFGHGNPVQLTHEGMFTVQDVSYINTHGKCPLAAMLTCKFGEFARLEPAHVIGEDWVLNTNGAIGVIASPYGTSPGANSSYADAIFTLALDGNVHVLGEVYQAGIQSQYFLEGDPATFFYYPVIDSSIFISSKNDTVTDGQLNTVSINKSIPVSYFYTEMLGQPYFKTYTTLFNHSVSYYESTPLLYKGSKESDNQIDTCKFFVPVDADTGKGMFSLIYSKYGKEYRAHSPTLSIVNGAPSGDKKGPLIDIYQNGEKITSDTIYTGSSANLVIKLSDESGINLSQNGDESGIELSLDNTFTDLVPYFEYDKNSYTDGEVKYTVQFDETQSIHTLTIIVRDNQNNTSTKTCFVQVEEQPFKIDNILIYPNPIRQEGNVYITFNLSATAKIQAKIFTIAGTMVWSSGRHFYPEGFNSILWDGKDLNGAVLSNGLYILYITANDTQHNKFLNFKKGIIISK